MDSTVCQQYDQTVRSAMLWPSPPVPPVSPCCLRQRKLAKSKSLHPGVQAGNAGQYQLAYSSLEKNRSRNASASCRAAASLFPEQCLGSVKTWKFCILGMYYYYYIIITIKLLLINRNVLRSPPFLNFLRRYIALEGLPVCRIREILKREM